MTSPVIGQLVGAEDATASAHEEFLRVARGFEALIGRNLEYQFGLIEALSSGVPWEGEAPAEHHLDQARQEPRSPENEIPCVLDRAQCLEFAVGSIAAVLGPEYAAIDGHPTRVRLPDEPLMLVDRIVTIEGEPRSLTSGRVVTEHDILAGAWYLDAGRIPPASPSSRARPTCSSPATWASTSSRGGWRSTGCSTPPSPSTAAARPGRSDPLRHQDHPVSSARETRTSSASSSTAPWRRAAARPCATAARGSSRPRSWPRARASSPGRWIRRPAPGSGRPTGPSSCLSAPSSLDERQVDALRRGDLAAAFGSAVRQARPGRPAPLARRPDDAGPPRRDPRPDRRPVRPGPDPRRGGHSPRRLVHGLPLRG